MGVTGLSLQIVTSASGKPSLKGIASDGREIFVHSAYDPELEAESWASKASLADASTVIICGFGLGYHIRAALARVKKHCILLVIDKNKEFLKEWLEENPLPESETQKVFLITNEELRSYVVSLSSYLSSRSGITFVEHAPSVQLDPEYYTHSLRTTVEALRGVKVQVNTHIHLGPFFLTNVIRNAPALLEDPGIKSLRNLLKGKPVILAAAGPSLGKHLDKLRELQGQIPIFAAGSTYQALHKQGIYPDGVACVDPHPTINYELYQGIAREDVALFYDMMSTPEVVQEFTGPRYAFHTSSAEITVQTARRRGTVGRLSPGGTVAAPLFHLLHYMGADPIILVGQDLALTNYATHVDGVTGAETEIPEESIDIWVDDWTGEGKVPTNSVLLLFLRNLEALYEQVTATGTTVIDATEGGARKKGTVQMTLREALDQYGEKRVDAKALLRQKYEAYRPSRTGRERVMAYYRNIDRRANRLMTLLKDAEETLRDLDRYIEAIKKPENALFRSSLIRRGDALHEKAARENVQIMKYQDVINLVDLSLPFTNWGPQADEEGLDTIVAAARLSYREIILALGYLLQVVQSVQAQWADQQHVAVKR